MGGSSSKFEKIHVVVVGGNFAGLHTAKKLEAIGFKVTIIEPKNRFYTNFAGVRAAAVPGFEAQALVPYDRFFKNKTLNSFIQARATGVDTGSKTVTYIPISSNDGAESAPAILKYDYLVIATGSNYGAPLKISSPNHRGAIADFQKIQQAVAGASNIVVVGGGSTGIELAGELRDAKPQATISLIHSGRTLLAGSAPGGKLPEKFRLAAQQKLETVLKVKCYMSAKAGRIPAGEGATYIAPDVVSGKITVALTSSQSGAQTPPASIPADLVFYATGPVANTGFLKGSSLASTIQPNGRIAVNSFYQVKGQTDVFALGDCCDSPDDKAAWVNFGIGPLVATNIQKLAAAVSNKKPIEKVSLKAGKKGGTGGIILLPMGAKRGMGYLPFGTVGDGMISSIKGKDLFTGNSALFLNYKATELAAANK